MPLTDTRVRTLTTGNRAERLVVDTNGLYLRLRKRKGGITRTWQFRRREAGKLSVVTLGTYPNIGLKDARLRAAELASRHNLESPTVTEAAEQWLAEQVHTAHRQPFQIEGYLQRALLPVLGSRRVRDVAPSEIARLIRDYRDRAGKSSKGHAGGKPAARALLAACKGLFRYAVANGWIEQSPAAQITTAIVGPRDRNRDRVLTDDEIRFVMTTDARPGPILRFLLATGLRIGEAYNGHREGQYWVVPPAASKNGRAHHVWLSQVALVQLDHFPWEPRRPWVQKWLNKAKTGGWTAHDLRRTFSTRNNAMGVAPYIVEKMINHTLPSMMGIYNHATYDTERQEALEAWSNYLLGFASEPAGENVVSLRAKALQAA